MRKKQDNTAAREIAIYSRKSKFTGKGESIENQIELCRRYIMSTEAVNGKAGTDECGETSCRFKIYEDEGFSGKTLDRPQFKQMMKDARQGKLSKIIVYRLDRISRNIGDFAGLIEELNHLEVDFISIKEQFDTSSPMGRAMMYIASVFSQLERETIAERIRDNMLELAKTGRWLGGITPLGYRSESVLTVTVDGRTKRCCALKLIESEGELVRSIYRYYLKTESLKETAEELFREGKRTRSGKRFTPPAVRAILSNPVYAAADEALQTYFGERNVPLFVCEEKWSGKYGAIAYNRTLQRPGKTNQMRNPGEWIVAVGKHQPLVLGEDWVRVQLRLEKNQRRNRSVTRKREQSNDYT